MKLICSYLNFVKYKTKKSKQERTNALFKNRGGECLHSIIPDSGLVFVLMPFKEFNSVYDSIKIAVESMDKKLRCERADDQYTHLSIWCNRICKNIRSAKYLIVDTTKRNPNVFYELGFSHAMENTKTIIITQSVEHAPFDISDINHIIYSEKDLPAMRDRIHNAIHSLESDESYANKTSEEVIRDLKHQLLDEEKRAAGFKKELLETRKENLNLRTRYEKLKPFRVIPPKKQKTKLFGLKVPLPN